MSEIELKTGSNVLLAVIICLLNIGWVLLAMVILLAKNLFGSACSGQYFMSEKNVLLAVVICLLNIGLVLLAVASIFITNMSGIKIAWRRGSFENLHYKSEIKRSEKRDSQTQSKATMIIWR